jgi:hypothetical protein
MSAKIEIFEVAQRSKKPFRVKIDGVVMTNLGDGKPRQFRTRKDAFTAAEWATNEERTDARYSGPRI